MQKQEKATLLSAVDAALSSATAVVQQVHVDDGKPPMEMVEHWLDEHPQAAAPELQQSTNTLEDRLAVMRSNGWRVAAHADYHAGGEVGTSWLFVHDGDGTFVSGEAGTDAAAIDLCIAQAVQMLRHLHTKD